MHIRLSALIIFASLLSIALPSHAQYLSSGLQQNKTDQHTRAVQAMQQGNYAIAYCLWQPLAENGDREAQFNIGWMYHNGYGLRINDEQAFSWWLKSAAQGSADAHFALGNLYANGQGVEKSMSIAFGWYISAALKDHTSARETLTALLSGENKLAINTFRQLLRTDWSILGETLEVNVEKANTREGPDKNFPVVTTLQKGQLVIPLKQQGNWTYIGITGTAKTAWIFSRLISQPSGIHAIDSVEQTIQ